MIVMLYPQIVSDYFFFLTLLFCFPHFSVVLLLLDEIKSSFLMKLRETVCHFLHKESLSELEKIIKFIVSVAVARHVTLLSVRYKSDIQTWESIFLLLLLNGIDMGVYSVPARSFVFSWYWDTSLE